MPVINLPLKFVYTVIDADIRDNQVLAIENVYSRLRDIQNAAEKEADGIRTVVSWPESAGQKNPPLISEYAIISRCIRRKITFINPEITYWNIRFKYYDDTGLTVPVPGFIKFYDRLKGNFIPVEYLRKSNVLIDYAGRSVQVASKTQLGSEFTDTLKNDFYYSISLNVDGLPLPGPRVPLYINEILCEASYNNYERRTGDKAKD